MDFITQTDFAILDALQKIHSPVLDCILAFFTYLGEGGAVWIAAAIVMLCINKSRSMGYSVSAALIYELILNEQIIKKIFCRTRPFVIHPEIDTFVVKPSSYSFPSGHTCSSFAAATAIFMYNRKLGIFAYIIAAAIGFSRNYFYIHYPTDVICGAATGIIYGIAAVMTVRAIEKLVRRSSQEEHQD